MSPPSPGEISLLKSQLKDCQGDQTTRNHELLHIRAQVREYAAQLETKEVDNKRLQAETQTLREQVRDTRAKQTRRRGGTGEGRAGGSDTSSGPGKAGTDSSPGLGTFLPTDNFGCNWVATLRLVAT